MGDWIALAVYLAGWVWMYRKSYVVWEDDMPSSDTLDRAGSTFISALIATFWPVTAVLMGIHRFLRPTTRADREQHLAEREAAADEREREIRRMERELGIGDPR